MIFVFLGESRAMFYQLVIFTNIDQNVLLQSHMNASKMANEVAKSLKSMLARFDKIFDESMLDRDSMNVSIDIRLDISYLVQNRKYLD